MGKIIINDQEYSVLGKTKLWTDTGLEFKPGFGARRRIQDLDLIVWHFTGGEGGANQLYRVLKNRRLGVEFFIDREGIVWQFCDPTKVDTFDAGIVNRRSVGIEIANYGYRRSKLMIPKKGRDRYIRNVALHGSLIKIADFYPCQIAAAISLADTLSEVLDIPRQVPEMLTRNLITRELSSTELNTFHGHIGHFHVTKRKIDPGPVLLEIFKDTFTVV